MELNEIKKTASWGQVATSINENYQKINSEVTKLKYTTNKCKGLHATGDALKAAFPEPLDGDWAIIGKTVPGPIWMATGGIWSNTGTTGGGGTIDVAGYATSEQLDAVNKKAGEALASAKEAKEQITKITPVFLSESDYENLPVKDPEVTYMVYEEE